MIRGVLYILAACFCWGFIFVVPKFSKGFSSLEITLGRFFFFGLISLGILFLQKRYLWKKDFYPIWIKAIGYGFVSTFLSYGFIVFAIRYANAAITTLIFGISPLAITFYGNFKKREFSFKSLILPSTFMLIGLFLANKEAFFQGEQGYTYLLGVVFAFFSLLSWTWFAVANCTFLKKNKEISSSDWIVMIGVTSFFIVMLICIPFIFSPPFVYKYTTISSELQIFLLGSLLLGVISSWIAGLFWNRGSLLIPISLAGQLSIFQMIFGLLFIFLVEQRPPLFFELTGIFCILSGLLLFFAKSPLFLKAEK